MEQNKIPPDNKWPAVTMRWRKLVCLVLRNLSRIQFMSVHVSGGVLGLFGSKPSVRDDEAYASLVAVRYSRPSTKFAYAP